MIDCHTDQLIIFDCIETLIDVSKIPTIADYTCWALEGLKGTDFWGDQRRFIKSYIHCKEEIEQALEIHQEYEIHITRPE